MRNFFEKFSVLAFMALTCSQVIASKYVILDPDSSAETYKMYLLKIPKEDKVLITWKKELTKEKEKELSSVFSEILPVDNYYNSASVEVTAIQLHKKYGIKRIITPPCAEYDLVRAGHLRDYLGIKGQTYKSALVFRDKVLMKKRVWEAGLEVPPYISTSCGLDLIQFADKNGFPIVVKPRTGVGSVQTYLINDTNALNQFLSENYNCHYFSNYEAESFIKGRVYHIDGLVNNGAVLAWPSVYINTCLENALEKKFLGSHILEAGNPLTSKLIAYAEKALKILPTPQETTFHLEVFVRGNDEKIVLCEIASRVGGVFVDNVWQEAFGISLKDSFYDMQAGLFKKLPYESLSKPTTIAGWVMYPAILGKIVKSIKKTCPFSYCKSYVISVNVGDKIGNSTDIWYESLRDSTGGIFNSLGKALIVAKNESEFVRNVKELTSWFTSNFEYE